MSFVSLVGLMNNACNIRGGMHPLVPLILFAVALIQYSCHLAPEVREGQQQPVKPTASAGSFGRAEQDVNHAEVLLAEGKVDKAIAELKKTVARAPNHPRSNLLYAAALLRQGNTHEAKRHLSRVVKKWPELSEGRLLMGYALVEKGEKRQALEQFQKVLELTRDSEERLSAHLALASIYEEDGDQAQANHHYAQALTIEPALRDVLTNVQKELLWHEPQSITGKDLGELESVKARRKRMESHLKRLRGEDSK